MSKIAFIQNLITPYRSSFFNDLSKVADIKVYYMGKTEADRNWDPDSIYIDHPHWIDKNGLYFMFKGFHIHINPILIWKILTDRSINKVILGVAYCDITIMLLALIKHLKLTKKRFYFWAEANYLTNGARKDSKLKYHLRKFVFSCIDGALIVPGKMSIITFDKWDVKDKKFILLPNTVDEDACAYTPKMQNNTSPNFIIPIRLIESIKGLLNFFEAIGESNIKKCTFHVAGAGKDLKMYQDFISKNNFSKNIILEGYCDSTKMNQLYNNADALILPSYSDPSPLSIVEALIYHLPIICSSHCGNHFEAVRPEENGYVFNPLIKEDIKEKFELFLNNKNWKQMGEISYSLFKKNFCLNRNIESFVEQIEKI